MKSFSAPATVVFAALLAACGGMVSVEPTDGGGIDGPPDALTDDGAPEVPDGPCTILGSAVCNSSGCVDGCKKDLCLEFKDPASGTYFAPGVCADSKSRFAGLNAIPCNVCDNATDLCIYSAYELVCVPPEVCSRFSALDGSKKTPCLYQDKTPWHPSDVIPNEPCPSFSPVVGVCGGKCPACPGGTVCSGVSAVSGIGVCVPPLAGSSRNRCWRGIKGCAVGESCMTFVVGSIGVQSVADSYGVCIGASRCKELIKAFSGTTRVQCD